MARDAEFNLAVETSSRCGSVTLGRGDAMLASAKLPEQRRHAVELMPAIDALCRGHGASARHIGEYYVSIGPGSFTGLRVGVTTVKTLAYVSGAKVVGVPTLRVVARNAPPDTGRVAVLLNAKGGRCFTGVYEGDREVMAPCLMTPGELCQRHRGAVIGDHLPAFEWPREIQLLDQALSIPRSQVVWELGRALAREGRFTPAMDLTPLYVRLPEAEELWLERHDGAS